MRFITLLSLLMLLVLAKADAQLTSPQEFFDDYTQAFTPHHQLVAYFEQIAAASPRVHVAQYGTSYEGRPLILAYISSAANIAALEDLRQNHLQRSGILAGNATGTEMAVVWLSNSVHGNEAAGSEASPQVLYALANAAAPDSLATYLENTIVILDPSLNPDGYSRYTNGQRQRATLLPEADPAAWEHEEPWPGGRTNHYQFDLNRDWAWATQQETQARLKIYRQWMPHVHADIHEMGANSSYYFPPAAEPFHAYITDWQREFQTMIGRNHARLFDEQGWLYYTREEFDLLYPSYGDTYPTFNGAIGMTYEQGGSGRAGRALLRSEGDTITLADRIAHHYTTSISTVAVASRNASKLAANANDFTAFAKTKQRGDYKAYVFPNASNSLGKLRPLQRLLDVHGIAYGSADRGGKVAGSFYGSNQSNQYQAGDLVVSAQQLQGVLAQVLLDPSSELSDSITYDITAWSLPLVFGLQGFASREAIATTQGFGSSFVDTPIDVTAPKYGFALRIESLQNWVDLAPLLAAGLVARQNSAVATMQVQNLPAGSLYVLQRDQTEDNYLKAYSRLVNSAIPLKGGLITGGRDVGSDAVQLIDGPKVALLQDDALDANAFGHVWHFFEQRLRYPIMPVPLNKLSASALASIDVLIMTDGNISFGESRANMLAEWVRDGGRIIAMQGSAEALGREAGFALSMKEKSPVLQVGSSKSDPMQPYANKQRASISSNMPGALIETQVDVTHPMAVGVSKDFYALRTDQREWDFLESGANVIGIRDQPKIVGFVGAQVRESLDETLTLGVQTMGVGQVIYAADNLAYRGFWEQGMLVLANAVFYGG